MQQTEIISFIIVSGALLIVFVIGIIAFVLQYRKKRVEHENEKEMITVKHNEELLSTQLEIQLQTMQHIGREIHDNVGQKLTLASIYTQQLSYENKAPQINEKIVSISNIINESLKELRLLSKSLTDDVIANNDLISLINIECEKVKALKQIEVNFEKKPTFIKANYKTKNVMIRIVQEFLQNSIKHSQCKKINIQIYIKENNIELEINDDGIGFDTQTNKASGIGLKNIAKRVQLLNGDYKLNSMINGGTFLFLKIPASNEA